jgi:hypothetical protein
MPHELRILQAARLKSRPTPADLAAAVGLPENQADAAVEPLIATGALTHVGSRLKLTAAGRARLEQLLARERASVDRELLRSHYVDFDELNSAFLLLVTDWQLVNGTRPNDHSDATYDAAVLRRLGDVHRQITLLLDRLVQIAPRLESYGHRFTAALAKVDAGEHSWFTYPLVDSYHTVWFELHEDLIGLAGLSRAGQAAGGSRMTARATSRLQPRRGVPRPPAAGDGTGAAARAGERRSAATEISEWSEE